MKFFILVTLVFIIKLEPSHSTVNHFFTPIELCDNAIDDDGDGLIDLNDPDCECAIIEEVSLIPNSSFEDRTCCPSKRAQMNCTDFWIQASFPDADYIHDCNYQGRDEFKPPRPFPDGSGIVGFRDGLYERNEQDPSNSFSIPAWKEYIGTCLNEPLLANQAYALQVNIGFVSSYSSPAINMTVYGSTDCDSLPFGNNILGFGCPTNGPGWVELGVVTAMGSEEWKEYTIDIEPSEDIYAIVLGPECKMHFLEKSTYYYLDDLFLASEEVFETRIEELGERCHDTFSLFVHANLNTNLQWYHKGIALIGETNPQLSMMYGNGTYQVRVMDGSACRLSKEYYFSRVDAAVNITASICASERFHFADQMLSDGGQYEGIFKTEFGCDSVVTLDLKVLGEFTDSVKLRMFEGDVYAAGNQNIRSEGLHLLTLPSTMGCDSLVALTIEYYNVYIPNVFSPNNDGINDLFTVFDKDDEISTVDIAIFTRWGAQIHQGDSWDGRNKNQHFVDSGVFAYVATIEMFDGATKQFEGSLTVLR